MLLKTFCSYKNPNIISKTQSNCTVSQQENIPENEVITKWWAECTDQKTYQHLKPLVRQFALLVIAVKLEMFGILLEHVFLAHVFMSYLSW